MESVNESKSRVRKNRKDNGGVVRCAVLRVRSSAGGEKRPAPSVGSRKTGNSNYQHKASGNGGCIIPQGRNEDCANPSEVRRGVSRDSEIEKYEFVKRKSRELLDAYANLKTPKADEGKCFLCERVSGANGGSAGNLRIHEVVIAGNSTPVCSICHGTRVLIAMKNKMNIDDELVIAKWLANRLLKS